MEEEGLGFFTRARRAIVGNANRSGKSASELKSAEHVVKNGSTMNAPRSRSTVEKTQANDDQVQIEVDTNSLEQKVNGSVENEVDKDANEEEKEDEVGEEEEEEEGGKKSHRKYSFYENVWIVRFGVKLSKEGGGSSSINKWKLAENDGICPGRTAWSMRGQFRRLLKNPQVFQMILKEIESGNVLEIEHVRELEEQETEKEKNSKQKSKKKTEMDKKLRKTNGKEKISPTQAAELLENEGLTGKKRKFESDQSAFYGEGEKVCDHAGHVILNENEMISLRPRHEESVQDVQCRIEQWLEMWNTVDSKCDSMELPDENIVAFYKRKSNSLSKRYNVPISVINHALLLYDGEWEKVLSYIRRQAPKIPRVY
uniref:Uncharacterized protein n=1 Tax=Timspurckia oligopyrenoides TaxID=708627 RepID=A0A7S0ZD00_9RHOD|mmetsp:Transcript_12923/g.23244  ORF Transcript_12923/g.23244 Transcript_12923/m.23244 type:complete len:370 (+) Transcript_12923:32-1141(+)